MHEIICLTDLDASTNRTSYPMEMKNPITTIIPRRNDLATIQLKYDFIIHVHSSSFSFIWRSVSFGLCTAHNGQYTQWMSNERSCDFRLRFLPGVDWIAVVWRQRTKAGADAEIWEFSTSFHCCAGPERVNQAATLGDMAGNYKQTLTIQFALWLRSDLSAGCEWPSVLELGVELSRQKTLTGVGSLTRHFHYTVQFPHTSNYRFTLPHCHSRESLNQCPLLSIHRTYRIQSHFHFIWSHRLITLSCCSFGLGPGAEECAVAEAVKQSVRVSISIRIGIN